MLTIDIGCGTAKTPGAVGLDCLPLQGVDIVCDLARFPWPLADNSTDLVIFNHSIQYLGPFERLLEELKRICKNDSLIEIRSPHFSSYNYFSDPLYRFPLAWRTFDFWEPKSDFKYNYYGGGIFAIKILHREISFSSRLNPWRWIGFQAFANRFPRFYERFLAFTFPAQEIRYKLRILK
jgi:SAM-dependent methyltransferase